MPMKFTPKSEKEINDERLLPEGEYSFEVSGAEAAQSKKGNDMIVLTVRVYKPDGSFVLVTDYLLEAMLYKLLHFCQAVGLEEKYNQGILDANDCIGKTGVLKLKIDPEGDYPAKNSIKDYVVGEKSNINKDALSKVIDGEDDLADEIPF